MNEKKQHTIGSEVTFSGRALQTGQSAEMTCLPQEADTGIVFKRLDLPGSPCIRLKDGSFSEKKRRRSTIGAGPFAVQTIEHFLAALWGAGVDNLLVEISGPELPAMDGSAKVFLEELRKADIVEQNADRRQINIVETVKVENSGRSLTIFPAERLEVSYCIDYDIPYIQEETFTIELDRDKFAAEIAPARTFCLKNEAEKLLRAGIGKGATPDNTLIIDDDGPMETKPRFSNEPVRHKVLDLIGDLYMLGVPIMGRIAADRSGHAINAKMVEKLYNRYIKKG